MLPVLTCVAVGKTLDQEKELRPPLVHSDRIYRAVSVQGKPWTHKRG